MAPASRGGKLHCGADDGFPAIEDYAMIGDCRAAALVSRSGQLDWLCWPRFDSPSIFAALLDREHGGHWRIAPRAPYSAERAYISESNVLETRFRTDSGTLLLTDLMPVTESRASLVPDHEIVRRLSCMDGEAEVEVELAPRARYGGVVPALRQVGRLGIRIECGRGVYWLRSSIPLRLGEGSASTVTRLKAGQSLLFSFSYAEEAPAMLPPIEEIPQRIEECVRWWQQ